MLKFCAILLIAAATATCIISQPLPPAPVKTVWEGMFPPPYLQSPQIGLAMDCVSANLCYIGGASNGAGAGVFKYDGKLNGAVVNMPMPNQSMMVFDLAVSGTEANPTGVFTSVDLFLMISQGLQYLANGGSEWLASLIPLDFIWQSQSVTSYKSNPETFVAIGNGIQNLIMTTTDGGKAFAGENINFHYDEYNCSYAYAGSFLSDSVWYLTWGAQPPQKNSGSSSSGSSFNADNQNVGSSSFVDSKYIDLQTERIVGTKSLGRVLVIQNIKTGDTRLHTKSIKQWREDQRTVQKNNPVCNYYKGAILKSTDQGKTWSKVFEVPDMMTSFIQCYDEQHCSVIAYNADATATITTQDGNNWKIAYTTPAPTQTEDIVMQNIGYASQTEIWVGGGKDTQAGGQGMFWVSNDSGVTFTPYPHYIPDIDAVMVLSCPEENVCFAMGLTEFKTTQIMRYKKQADYGNFIQSNCAIKGCLLCQNISFPQGVCLQAQGGSAKAICTPNGIVQYMYETTSCVGSYTKQNQPINVCLNSTQGGYFENYCPGQQGFSTSGARAATKRDKLKRI